MSDQRSARPIRESAEPDLTFGPETKFSAIDFPFGEQTLEVSLFHRPAGPRTLVYFHGLGSTKADFAGATRCQDLSDYTIVGFDYPGSGGSSYPDSQAVSLTDLGEIASRVFERLELHNVTAVAHSMGGAVALLSARKHPDIVGAMINVEGNLAPIDCEMFSGEAAAMPFPEFAARFFEHLRLEYQRSANAGFAVYSELFPRNVGEKPFHDYSQSLVELTDTGQLLDWFCALEIPRLFVYGSENRSLPYLDRLACAGIRLAEIGASNHFPIYSNPADFYQVLADFVRQPEAANYGDGTARCVEVGQTKA